MTIKSALIAAAATSLLATGSLSAQTAADSTPRKPSRWELAVPNGTLTPTGAQRGAIKRGNMTAVQLSFLAAPAVAITSTMGWARSRDVVAADNPKLDVFTYDVGAELRAPRWTNGKSVTLMPFAGAGAGGRSYDYRKLDERATHNISAYGSVGSELGVRRVRIRLEARDYVAGFKPLTGTGAARTGNDVVVLAAVRVVGR